MQANKNVLMGVVISLALIGFFFFQDSLLFPFVFSFLGFAGLSFVYLRQLSLSKDKDQEFLVAQNFKLTQDVKAAEERYEEFSVEFATEKERLQFDMKRLKEERDSIESSLAKLVSESKALKKYRSQEYIKLENTAKNHQFTIGQKENFIQHQENQILEIEGKLLEAELDLQASRTDYSTLYAKYSESEENCAKLLTTISELTQTSNQEKETTQKAYLDLEDSRNYLFDQLAHQKQLVSNKEAKIDQLEQARIQLQEEMLKKEGTLTKKETELKDTQENLSKLSAKLSKIKEILEEKEETKVFLIREEEPLFNNIQEYNEEDDVIIGDTSGSPKEIQETRISFLTAETFVDHLELKDPDVDSDTRFFS